MQNTSHAVMAQRIEPKDSRDDFPTPPWATRGLVEHIIRPKEQFERQTCLEPACGVGHMSKVLEEYFGRVISSDKFDYGYGRVHDYLDDAWPSQPVDWVITNPPFRLAEEFVLKSLRVARHGVAILARTVFIESIGRYDRIFRDKPPSKFAQFTERVPMVQGRLDKKASTATGYSWIVWEKSYVGEPKLVWVPPCRKLLEKDNDYDRPPRPVERINHIPQHGENKQLEFLVT